MIKLSSQIFLMNKLPFNNIASNILQSFYGPLTYLLSSNFYLHYDFQAFILRLQQKLIIGVVEYNIKMSSNKFLQRFEGKIQVVGKQGVNNVFGGKNDNVIVYTNSNFNQQNKNKTSSSLNKPKPQQIVKQTRVQPKVVHHPIEGSSKKQQKKNTNIPLPKQKKIQANPFVISNPFYLDEEDKQKMERQRKQRELLQKQEKERERQALRLAQQDSKKVTNSSLNKSLQKKKNQKEWVKMGGLGANIGGDQWLQKKKKLDKMQEFSEQVKSINKDKPKIPKQQKRQQRKDVNPRSKALQYSKNVPKPVVRIPAIQREENQQVQEHVPQQQLSELQLYELRHEQYKNMLKNQL